MYKLADKDVKRFLSKIDKTKQGRQYDPNLYPNCNNDCWRYIGFIGNEGYGYFQLKRKCLLAHRVSYQIFKDEIPEGMQIRHTCDCKWCVNPNQLIVGTSQDDANDRKYRDMQKIGSQVNTSVLTEDQVRKILTDVYNNKYENIKQLCDEYGISKVSMRKIFTGDNWKCITRELKVPLEEIYVKIYKPSKGKHHHSSKLTNNDIIIIRERIQNGETLQSIADDIGISRSAVSNIKNRKHWKEV